jgi:hypothetical protein
MNDKREKPAPETETSERGQHNRLGFYNADEEATFDERGTQGEGAGERRDTTETE